MSESKGGAERRVHKRIDVDLPGRLYVPQLEKEFEVRIGNISEGGVYIKTEGIPLVIGQEVTVTILFAEGLKIDAKIVLHHKTLDSLPDEVAERAHVKWLRLAMSDGFGIQFTNLKDETKKFIRKLILHTEIEEEMGK